MTRRRYWVTTVLWSEEVVTGRTHSRAPNYIILPPALGAARVVLARRGVITRRRYWATAVFWSQEVVTGPTRSPARNYMILPLACGPPPATSLPVVIRTPQRY